MGGSGLDPLGIPGFDGSRGGFIPFPGILPTPPVLWDDEDPKFQSHALEKSNRIPAPHFGKIQLDFVVLKMEKKTTSGNTNFVHGVCK